MNESKLALASYIIIFLITIIIIAIFPLFGIPLVIACVGVFLFYKPKQMSKSVVKSHMSLNDDQNENNVNTIENVNDENNDEDEKSQLIPSAANLIERNVDFNEPFENPMIRQKEMEEKWFNKKSHKDLQEEKFKMLWHRRRDWAGTGRWTKEDATKYESARRAMESKIANSLRPDPYTIVEPDPSDERGVSSHQPFATLHSDPILHHSARHHKMSAHSGDLAASLRSTF